jgi:hypothetical protein
MRNISAQKYQESKLNRTVLPESQALNGPELYDRRSNISSTSCRIAVDVVDEAAMLFLLIISHNTGNQCEHQHEFAVKAKWEKRSREEHRNESNFTDRSRWHWFGLS